MKKIRLIDAAIIILTIVVFILILQKLFGSSPTEVQVTFGLASILFTFLLKINSSHNKLNREVGELKTDVQHIHQKLDDVEKSLIAIKTKLKVR